MNIKWNLKESLEMRTVAIVMQPFPESCEPDAPFLRIVIEKRFRNGEWEPARITRTEHNIGSPDVVRAMARALMVAADVGDRLDVSPDKTGVVRDVAMSMGFKMSMDLSES